MTLSSCRMKSPQLIFRRRKYHKLYRSYRNGAREDRNLSGARDVHLVHFETGHAQIRYEKAKTRCGTKTKLDDTMRRTIIGELCVQPGPRNRSSATSTRSKLPSPPSTVGSMSDGSTCPCSVEGQTLRTGGSTRRADHLEPRSRWRGQSMGFISPTRTRRGNENANGLLREFFPKGTDFAKVTHDELADEFAKTNWRPRKCCA